MFDAATSGKTVFILDANPRTKADGAAAFGQGGLYNIHIAADREMSSGMTLTFRYSNGHMVVGKLDGANPALGVEGKQIGMAQVGTTADLAGGIRIWTGAAKDPFVGNAAGISLFRKQIREGVYDETAFDNAKDFFGKLYTSAIVVEVPNTMLPKNINVYASSAMQIGGKWMQVNRLATVLLTHLFLLGDPTLASDHVQHRPNDDGQRRLWVSSLTSRVVTQAKTRDDPTAYGDIVADRLLPDMIPYEVGTPAKYDVKRFNGRRTNDDAMDVMLSIFSGKTLTDKANVFDHHPQKFPYLVPVKVEE